MSSAACQDVHADGSKAGAGTAGPAPAVTGATVLQRWMPGLNSLRRYPRRWLFNDAMAGLVLTAMLVPIGMGYAEASGLPAIHGLYATILPLLAYAVFGPSRIMVLGPDSTLAAVIAALILPLAAGSVERAVALAGALALISGACLLLIGFVRLGMMADLFSKPIRIGFMNAIALTVIIGQLPKVFGFSVKADSLVEKLLLLVQGVAGGRVNVVACAIGLGSLGLILLMRHWRPQWPGMLLAVILATGLSAAFDLGRSAQLAVLGPMPQGLPALKLPWIGWSDLAQLLPGRPSSPCCPLPTPACCRGRWRRAATTASARTRRCLPWVWPTSRPACSRAFRSAAVPPERLAELAGSRCSRSRGWWVPGHRVPVDPGAQSAQAPAQRIAGRGGDDPAVCLSFADVPGMFHLYRQRRMEFALSAISFLGVAFVGVSRASSSPSCWPCWCWCGMPGTRTTCHAGAGERRKGFHDVQRHPERTVRSRPGDRSLGRPAVLRDAEIVRYRVLQGWREPRRTPEVADRGGRCHHRRRHHRGGSLQSLHQELQQLGVELHFAGLKGLVKDRLAHVPALHDGIDQKTRLSPTVGSAVNRYRRSQHTVDWKDCRRGVGLPGFHGLGDQRAARRQRQEHSVVARAAPTQAFSIRISIHRMRRAPTPIDHRFLREIQATHPDGLPAAASSPSCQEQLRHGLAHGRAGRGVRSSASMARHCSTMTAPPLRSASATMARSDAGTHRPPATPTSAPQGSTR